MSERTPLRRAQMEDADGYQSMLGNGRLNGRTHALKLAALYVRAAVRDRRIDHKTDATSLRLVEVYYDSWVLNVLVSIALWGYLLITFVEDNEHHKPWAMIVELCCWLVLALTFLLRVMFTERRRLQSSRFAKVHIVALVVALVDLAYAWSTHTLAGRTTYRYARIVRPILQLEYSQVVRRRAVDILRTTYRVKAALLLLFFQITFFAVVSMFLFNGTPEGKAYFSTMGQSLVTLIILLSTCNSPKVMLPAFKENRLSALYFVLYLLVSVFLMLNLVLAVVYNEHRRHLKREAKRLAVRRRVCTSAAFRVLISQASSRSEPAMSAFSREQYDTGLPPDLVSDLLCKLGFAQAEARGVAMMLSTSSQGEQPCVSRDDFEDVLLLVHVAEHGRVASDPGEDEVDLTRERQNARAEEAAGEASGEAAPAPTLPRTGAGRAQGSPASEPFRPNFDPETDGETAWPRCWPGCGKTRRTSARGSKRFAIRVVMHHTWLGQHFGYVKTLDSVVNTLLITSGFSTVLILSLNPESIAGDEPVAVSIFNTICSLVFAVEMALRVHAAGVWRFFRYKWNVFEFTIVLLSFMAVATQFSGLTFFTRNHHLFLFLRKLRLLRLLRSVPQFRLLTEIVTNLLPALYTFGRVIFTFMYMYAIVGMGLLGDVRLPPEQYAANDFSSFPLALLTLFELMVVNDWNATMASFYEATGESSVQLYFVVWYIFAVIVLLNSVTSFALEALDVHITQSNLFQNVRDTINGTPPPTPPSPHPLARPYGSEFGGALLQQGNRELKRGMSFAHRALDVERLGVVNKRRPLEGNIARLLGDVFNDEVDEPTTMEIDRELSRIGLGHLAHHSLGSARFR